MTRFFVFFRIRTNFAKKCFFANMPMVISGNRVYLAPKRESIRYGRVQASGEYIQTHIFICNRARRVFFRGARSGSVFLLTGKCPIPILSVSSFREKARAFSPKSLRILTPADQIVTGAEKNLTLAFVGYIPFSSLVTRDHSRRIRPLPPRLSLN